MTGTAEYLKLIEYPRNNNGSPKNRLYSYQIQPMKYRRGIQNDRKYITIQAQEKNIDAIKIGI